MRYSLLLPFILLIFTFCGERSASEAPDLILVNGKIWTGENESDFVESVAIKGSTIIETGTSAVLKSRAGDSTRIIDLSGKLVIAGFNDAHIHFLSGSMGLTQVDLLSTTHFDEVIERTLAFMNANPDKEWITGRGWQYTYFTTGLPDHASMAALDTDRPVFLRAYDGHSAYANRKALELAGIDANTVFEGFGEVVKDSNGNPTGALKEGAMRLVDQIVPLPTREDQLNAVREGLKMAASLGITSVQNANGSEEDLKIFKQLFELGELTVRYAACFSLGEQTTEEQLNRYIFLKDSVGNDHPWLRADAIKFMIDGVIESHTASMIEPYSDLSPEHELARGLLNLTLPRYNELVQRLDKEGFRIYTHAIGDNGVRQVLNAYEKAIEVNGEKERRHRIEHIETIKPEDIPRFAKTGTMASMEPIHADPATVSVWSRAVGDDRLPWSFAWNSLVKSGASLVFSSDWPAAISVDPIRGIHVAVNRRDPSGFPEGGWLPEQRVSVAQALKAFTYMGAVSSWEEDYKGLIKKGYLADLVVLSADLFTIDPMDIYKTKVDMTILDGKIIYEKD